MIIFLTALIIFFITAIGYSVINLFNFKIKSLIEKLAYSWGLGVGLIGTQLFFYSVIGIEWTRSSLITPWTLLIIFFLWKNKPNLKFRREKFDKVEKFFLILIILLLVFTAIESALRPVQAWDGWSNWLLRPKVFFLENNLSLDYVRHTTDEYPLIIPLMSTFDYKLIGQINDREVLLLFFVFYLAIACLFYAKSNEMVGRKGAIIFTFLLISTQNLIRHGGRYEVGQADLALGFFILANACLLINFLRSGKLKDLFFLNLFLAFTALVKNDGIPIFLIGNLMTVFYVIKSRKLIYAYSFIPSVILFGSWNLYKFLNDYPKNFILGSGEIHIDKVGTIVIAMAREFINFQNWNMLWIVFIASLILYFKDIKKILPLFLLISTQWIFYFFAFILSPYPNAVDHVKGIIDRLYIHVAPLALLITVALISINTKKRKNNSNFGIKFFNRFYNVSNLPFGQFWKHRK